MGQTAPTRIDLKFVVVDCTKETWRDPQTRDYFSELVQLRLDGYGGEYPAAMLPLDQIDWIGTHLVVCRHEQGKQRPVMAYRVATLSRAREFGLDFPGVAIPQASGAAAQAAAAREIVSRCDERGRELAYFSSWTIAPDVREDRALTRDLRDMTCASHLLLQECYGIDEALVTGVLRFKSEQFQIAIGYRPLAHEGIALPPFGQRSLAGEPVLMLHLEQFSARTRELAERYRPLWERRLTLGTELRLPGAVRPAAAITPIRRAA